MTKLAAVFFTSVLLVLLASPAAAQTGATAVSAIPVSGTFVDRAGGTGTFVGTLAIDRFESRDRALVLVGRLAGTLTDAAGGTRTVAEQDVAVPVTSVAVGGGAQARADAPITTQQAATDQCRILHLAFGASRLTCLASTFRSARSLSTSR